MGHRATQRAIAYAEAQFGAANIDDLRLLATYCPEVVTAHLAMRQDLMSEPPDGALSRKEKELVILAIECAAHKTNPPPTAHARLAVEAGATPAEIAEVLALCIMLGGMMTYRESGRFVLAEAVTVFSEGSIASSQVGSGPGDVG